MYGYSFNSFKLWKEKAAVTEMWHKQNSYMSVIYMVCMLLGSNQERDFQWTSMLSMFSHMLGFSNSLTTPKGSCDTITTCQGVWRWRFSCYSEKNNKLNTISDFLRDRKLKNPFKRLDFKMLLVKILIIWH